MIFNEHYDLEGKHAFLSASKYHWLNYSEDKLVETFANYLATERGTRLHEFAKEAIELGIKLKGKTTIALYVNDAIGYRMTPEQVLYYSPNCFGTTDSIAFSKNLLRIHDLKTGTTPASMDQLKVYNALFCLEYKYKPSDISMISRIYQENEIYEMEQDPEEIKAIMEKIIKFDKKIDSVKGELL